MSDKNTQQKNSSSRIRVLDLQDLLMVSGGEALGIADPDGAHAWSTTSNGCGSVETDEWSTESNTCPR